MAFFVTARVTQFYCELFQTMGIPVLEMHSRKSQPQRTRAAEQFRNSQRCIMFSSDVRACSDAAIHCLPNACCVTLSCMPAYTGVSTRCGLPRRQPGRPGAHLSCQPSFVHAASAVQDLNSAPWVQLGLPMEKAQYIHRLGRTARAGKSGKGLIILGERLLPC